MPIPAPHPPYSPHRYDARQRRQQAYILMAVNFGQPKGECRQQIAQPAVNHHRCGRGDAGTGKQCLQPRLVDDVVVGWVLQVGCEVPGDRARNMARPIFAVAPDRFDEADSGVREVVSNPLRADQTFRMSVTGYFASLYRRATLKLTRLRASTTSHFIKHLDWLITLVHPSSSKSR